jgi:hypothetical protein
MTSPTIAAKGEHPCGRRRLERCQMCWCHIVLMASRSSGVIRTIPQTRRLLEQYMQVLAVARAHKLDMAYTAVSDTMKFIDGLPAAGTSLQRDIADGKPSELEYWNGAVCRQARAAPPARAARGQRRPGCLNNFSASISGASAGLGCQAEGQRFAAGSIGRHAVKARVCRRTRCPGLAEELADTHPTLYARRRPMVPHAAHGHSSSRLDARRAGADLSRPL